MNYIVEEINGYKVHKLGFPLPEILQWDNQQKQYPESQPEGFFYMQGQMGDKYVDCLLLYNEKQELVGIFNHFPFDFPPYEQKGNMAIWIKPTEQGKGLGKKLLTEGVNRFQINLKQQTYTKQGYKLLLSYLKNQ